MNKIGIVDYGINNISSVAKALDIIQIPYEVLSHGKSIDNFGHIILPGVGSFGAACENLEHLGFSKGLPRFVKKGGFLLGICLGMQLLLEYSDESKDKVMGLGLIKGRCRKLTDDSSKKIFVPHIGWNSVQIQKSKNLFASIIDGSHFYFVHSYHPEPVDDNYTAAICLHGRKFIAAVEKENLMGTQFHPEKSFTNGLKILANFSQLN